MARLYPWLAAVLAIALMVLGYCYLKQSAEMGLIRAELTEKSFHAEQDHRQIADYQKRLTAANDAAKKAEEELVAQDHAATASAPTVTRRTQVINMNDIARDHPEYVELQRKQMRRAMLRLYGDTLSTLNLPPEQLAQLKDLLANRTLLPGDPRVAGLTQGTPAYNQAARAASQEVNQEIDALIGADNQAKLRDAQIVQMGQSLVANNYAPDFQDAGVPLSPEQTRSLAQLLSPGNMAGQSLGSAQPDSTTGLSPRDDALIEQAAQIMSPAQLAILKSDRADQNRMTAIMQEYTSPTATGGRTVIMQGGGSVIINGR